MGGLMGWRSSFWGLLARKAVILVCTVITALQGQLVAALVIAGLLTGTTMLSALSGAWSRWQMCAAESLAAALVIGSLFPAGATYVPYLVVPIYVTGLSEGGRRALVVAGVSGAALVALELLDPRVTAVASSNEPLTRPVLWIPLLAATALVAGGTRRVTRPDRPVVEPAYTDAHRLLSELNLVARQLSLGLDPPTLAAALVEELQELAAGSRATVLIRSAAGRFVPVVGDTPNPLTESAVLDAWVSADLVRRGRSGVTVVALPVLMGERVVAVVVLADTTGPHSLGEESVAACRGVIAQAGPRLASALLFDDVRRLATVDERHRLAREIHDGIAQDMASVGYQIDDIASDAPPAVSRRLHELREHLTRLVSELRLSIFDLRAGVDESVGLSRTLGDYAQRVGKQSGLVVTVSADESPHRLPLATEVEILRIVQEAVTNVRRHAYANHLWLTVVVDPPNAHVVVADDGRGLGRPRPDSMGITGMKERAGRIGATLTVGNRPEGSGTMVDLLLETRPRSTRSNRMVTGARHPLVVADSPDGEANVGAVWEGTS